jgi:hypothetical protein
MSHLMRIRTSLALIATSTLATLAMSSVSIAARGPEIKTFEAPGAGDNGATNQGTVGIGINDFGVIAGLVRDDNDVRHGFLRHPDGRFTIFNHPLGGTGPTQGTRVGGLNLLGAVAGSVRDGNNFDQPYVRDPDGNFFTVTSIPNFAGGNGDAINLWGAMVGNYLSLTDDQSILFHYHGFIRNPDGEITYFDPPGSQVTEIPTAAAINDFGAVTGDYWVCSPDLSACTVHGFIREPNGTYTVFDVKDAGPDGYSGQGTYPQGINALGEVSGYYADTNDIYHGFVRRASGHIETFDVPTTCTNASPPADCAYDGTFPGGINVQGKIVGSYYGEDGNPHGFWRDANGTIKTFDVQKPGYFTLPQSLNAWGQITGIAFDENFVTHGLLVIPEDCDR